MFSLRRPDILAVGDLGLQRGLLQWVLSSHLPDQYPLRLCPKKLPKSDDREAETGVGVSQASETQTTVGTDAGEASSVLPAPAIPTTPCKSTGEGEPELTTPEAGSSLPARAPTAPPQTPPRNKPAAKKAGKGKGKVREKDQAPTKVVSLRATKAVPLPEGITVEMLKSRANGKKVKGGCYLLPNEMHALTQAWAPYRSLGCFYLWALSEDDS
ncbi:hypothetical protein FS749_013267 [Ceratobasidium sp. UAMH 11750]|nr:hypothetical protein FS749_013267 [Ceratobasidium sp. UAMH 11750]